MFKASLAALNSLIEEYKEIDKGSAEEAFDTPHEEHEEEIEEKYHSKEQIRYVRVNPSLIPSNNIQSTTQQSTQPIEESKSTDKPSQPTINKAPIANTSTSKTTTSTPSKTTTTTNKSNTVGTKTTTTTANKGPVSSNTKTTTNTANKLASPSSKIGTGNSKTATPVVKRAKILKWDEDFKGNIPENSWFHAWSAWKIGYDYKILSGPDGIKCEINVNCTFDKNRAWSRKDKQNPDLLWHEQGHFDIAYAGALMFKKRVLETKFKKDDDFKSLIREMYKAMIKEYAKYQVQYDEETCHYCDDDEQARWNKKIEGMLKDLSKYA